MAVYKLLILALLHYHAGLAVDNKITLQDGSQATKCSSERQIFDPTTYECVDCPENARSDSTGSRLGTALLGAEAPVEIR